MPPALNCVTVASTLRSEEARQRLAAPFLERLANFDVRLSTAAAADRPEPLLVLVLTGGTEHEALQLLERRRLAGQAGPALLLAHAGQNSLAAAMEILARLHQDRQPGRILCVEDASDAAGWDAAAEALRDDVAYHRLRQARLGLIGTPSDWLVASSPSPEDVTRRWGPAVVPVPLPELADRFRQVAPGQVRESAEWLRAQAADIGEPGQSEIVDACRMHLALLALRADYRLDALALRCFDLVLEERVAGCLALALLGDSGVPAACEGDLCSAVGLLWSRVLLGQTGWMANPNSLNPVSGLLRLAHCTAPLGLLTRFRLRSHFESGCSVAIEGEVAPGPVTLLRVGGRQLEQLWLAEGILQAADHREDGCRTQVQVQLTGPEAGQLLRRPLGNHLVLVPGRHARRLRDWADLYRPPPRVETAILDAGHLTGGTGGSG